MTEPDTTNRFLVGTNASGERITFLREVPRVMNREDALNLAAWLVAVADKDGEFDVLLAAVQAT